jgi:hypothetical protein
MMAPVKQATWHNFPDRSPPSNHCKKLRPHTVIIVTPDFHLTLQSLCSDILIENFVMKVYNTCIYLPFRVRDLLTKVEKMAEVFLGF